MAEADGGETPSPGGFVVRSGVRAGLKRELAFALRSQSDLCPMGRTRSGKIRRCSPEKDDRPLEKDQPNREEATEVSSTVTTSGQSDGSEEVKGGSGGGGGGGSEEEGTTARKAEKKEKEKAPTKKAVGLVIKKPPGNIRELLGTGLLEGMAVKYVSSKNKKLLQGIVKERNIICSCSSCKGVKDISPYQFELHAGSTNKHPSDFIYLENGKSIRNVLRACSGAPVDTLELVILSAIGSDGNRKMSSYQQQTESCEKPSLGKSPAALDVHPTEKSSPENQCLMPVSSKCTRSSKSQAAPKQVATKQAAAPKSQVVTKPQMASKSQVPPKSQAAPITFDALPKSVSSQKKNASGRMTTKDLRLHKLVFMDDILPDGTEVAYYARGQRLLEGYIKGSGIFCRCCNTVVSPSQFESHAGWATRRKPYLNIYTSNGVSLHELSVSLSKERKHSITESDDLCRICSDGGDLLLCDLCPRAFHKECVGLSTIPEGDWYCPWCQKLHEREKYVEHNDNAIAAGRISGVDPIEEIFQRCIRIVQSPEADASSCVLCRCHDFSKSGFGPRTVLICDQCEKEYHIGCLKDYGIANLKELPRGKWFCCSDCDSMYAALQNMLSHESRQLPDHLSDTIRNKRKEKSLNNDGELDVSWRLIHGKMTCLKSKSLLSNVISIFHEAFGSINDSSTGQDLIPAMVYGQELRDQDFGGMYCAVLTVNSSVQSAGLFRVLGRAVAELPLVATSTECRGHGCFQALFSCIEGILQFLDVKHLVLPAAEEAEAIWTKKFGFSKINLEQLEEYAKGARTMMFQGAPILHKLVTTPNLCEGNGADAS